ncbi:hypothetical protein A3A64_01865 [Candidatus Gottesmanbacteria bacterium RIFCSPLOWO2_01_FULL_48_11]|uniref:Uncharacterized protein n=3 Tax=Candidatus Gottesmaniibacteriota TaxID=1752720 RepID=A0A1F6AST0_9BACT|nr:MAG: hypothetical protein A3A64_01865 [Candidatus Gottesmanbacteria bacterium RIFCSPLOWO2_01_FULL_48_11]
MWNFLLSHTPILYFTQSLWRDEAFSVLAAQRPLSFIFTKLGLEPPLYYMLLHGWTKLFGTSEVAARSLSLVGFTAATIIVIYWAEKLFKKHWLSWYLPVLFFFNPMLLYYAFEVRTYGWTMFFSVASMYGYVEKKWPIMIAANVLGFYNHSYLIFVPIAQGVHWLVTNKLRTLFRDPFIRSLAATFLFMVPWFIRIAQESSRLKTNWYYPADFNLVKSVLGNMFVGYEGTPWYLWPFTSYLSLILVFLFYLALKPQKTRLRNLFFLAVVFVPLVLVVGVSFFKPLYVNRYLIYVAIAEVFLLAFAIQAIKSPVVQKLLAFSFFLFTVSFNLWYPAQHSKVNIRQTFQEVNMLLGDQDSIFAASPLVLFESLYYAKDPNRVYLYNPMDLPFPHYVGDALVHPSLMRREFPSYPNRAFVIHEDGSFDITYATPN